MAIFNSYVKLPEGNDSLLLWLFCEDLGLSLNSECLNMRVSNGFAIWYITPVEGFFIEEVALKCQVLGCVQCIFDDIMQCTARQPNITCSVVLHYLEHNIHRACIYIYIYIHRWSFSVIHHIRLSFRTKPRIFRSAGRLQCFQRLRRDIAGFMLKHVEPPCFQFSLVHHGQS